MCGVSEFIHKKHNVSVLMYHIVCAAKYRRAVLSDAVDGIIRDVCLEIAKRYEIIFLEIGTDKDHVHFLVQSVPMYSPKKIVQIIKSITARQIFERAPEVKKQLWGGQFWGDGYFISTVGKYGNEDMIKNYVKKQGQPDKAYKRLHKQRKGDHPDQLTLF